MTSEPPHAPPALDRLTRFTDRAGDYARHRPSYPPQAIEAALAGLPATERIGVDIGAGTGISARLLADRGWTVHAVEPNSAMRTAAEAHPRVTWHAATGEHTGLADHSADLVLCAQAFHWLSPPAAIAEFKRILRPGGRIALIWNIHDEAWPISREFKSLMVRHATEPPTSPWFLPVGEPLAHTEGLINPRVIRVSNTQSLDEPGLLGRASSASYAPKSGPALEALNTALRTLFARFNTAGVLTLRYVTEVHLAETSP